MNKAERDEYLKQIKDEILVLKKSPLYAERTKNKVYPVIGEGNHFAEIMFVGEAPGRNESATGRPFCGAAGKILDELLKSVSIERKDVYITNIVKDRPPLNRDPLPEEIEIYGPFLDRQIEIIQPKIIATLGRYSMVYILSAYCGATTSGNKIPTISEAHGKSYDAETSYGNIKIIPLYHPAAAIYNRKLKKILLDDFKILRDCKCI